MEIRCFRKAGGLPFALACISGKPDLERPGAGARPEELAEAAGSGACSLLEGDGTDLIKKLVTLGAFQLRG